MSTTFFSTSEATGRRVDFPEIADTIAVIGVFGVIFLWISPHGSTGADLLASVAELCAIATSIALHRQAEVAREKRSNHVYRITPRTLKTLEAVQVPDDVIEGLRELAAESELTRGQFKREVQRSLGVARSQEWLETILLYSETMPGSKPPHDDAVKADDSLMDRPLH